MSTATTTDQGAPPPATGLHEHRLHPGSMLRAGVAEMVGTFFLIYTGTATAGAAALGKSTAGTPPDSLAVALAFGFVLTALVGALGQVSGAHLNGAVTLGLAVTGKFSWRYVPATSPSSCRQMVQPGCSSCHSPAETTRARRCTSGSPRR